jgi:hypothetical protein
MSLYRNYRAASTQVRNFATSSSLRVGPESPNYINVPQPLQPDLPQKPHVKGTLPVPRELFPARRPDKPSQAYIAAATPLPSKKSKFLPDDPNFEYNVWKQKMAEKRRQNLKESLLGLHGRKQNTDRLMAQRSREKQARRERILQQPPREDDYLTSSSVIQAMKPAPTFILQDPDREDRLVRSRALVAAKEAKKKAERQDALHTLYMNARNFITTEDQLTAEIERVFPEGENPAWRNDHQPGENIWNLGLPPTIQTIARDGSRTEAARWEAMQGRIKKLAEEITGGKL